MRAGDHAGMFVTVERDATGTGWQIWLFAPGPELPHPAGWDLWADDESEVQEWLDELDVVWLTGEERDATRRELDARTAPKQRRHRWSTRRR